MCMSVFCYMRVSTPHMDRVKRGHSGTGVANGCEPPYGCQEPKGNKSHEPLSRPQTLLFVPFLSVSYFLLCGSVLFTQQMPCEGVSCSQS